jgi:hypothetical protein
MAPIDCCLECLVAWRARAGDASQVLWRVTHLPNDDVHANDANARGRELDCKWNSVESSANLGYRARVRRTQLECLRRSPTAIDEQAYRVRALDLCDRAIRVRRVEGGYAPAAFAGHTQWFAARRQHAHLRTASQDMRCEVGASLNEVLAAVENEQYRAMLQGIDKYILYLAAQLPTNTQTGCDLTSDQGWVVKRGQFNQPYFVGRFGR